MRPGDYRRQTLHAKFPSQISTCLLKLPDFMALRTDFDLERRRCLHNCWRILLWKTAGVTLPQSKPHRSQDSLATSPTLSSPALPSHATGEAMPGWPVPLCLSPLCRAPSSSRRPQHDGGVWRAAPASGARRWGRTQLLTTENRAGTWSGVLRAPRPFGWGY